MKAILKLSIITIIFIKLLINNIDLTIEHFCNFYDYKQNYPSYLLDKVNSMFFHSLFRYTGFDTGYGFFSPNVSSNYIILNEIEYANNTKTIKNSDYMFRTKEGRLRFKSINDLYSELSVLSDTSSANDSIYQSYLKVILMQINHNIYKSVPEVQKINTSVFLYDFRSLNNYKKDNKNPEILINLYEYESIR